MYLAMISQEAMSCPLLPEILARTVLLSHEDYTLGDIDAKIMSVFMVLRPHRGWARVRHVLRVRAIVVYWLFLTEKLMGPEGNARKS